MGTQRCGTTVEYGDKPIQGHLRHSKAEITRNVYRQQVAPETWKAVVDLESKVNALGEAKIANAEPGTSDFVHLGKWPRLCADFVQSGSILLHLHARIKGMRE